jgi:mRNA interferase MazF
VYWANLNPTVGSEQAGRRPVVVISDNRVNQTFPIAVVAAITSQIKDRNSRRAPLLATGAPLPRESAVMTWQIRTLAVERLDAFVGELDSEQIERVSRGLASSLGLLMIPGSGIVSDP